MKFTPRTKSYRPEMYFYPLFMVQHALYSGHEYFEKCSFFHVPGMSENESVLKGNCKLVAARVNWKKKFVVGFFRICCRPGNWCRCSSIRFSISISTSLWNEKISLQFNLSSFPHLLHIIISSSSLCGDEKMWVHFDLSSSFEAGLVKLPPLNDT